MKVEVLMPKMGESITEGRILTWVKKPGDPVDRDESILEIATDKVDTEVPSPASGILVQVLAAEGDTVEVGATIAFIETEVSNASVVSDVPTAPVHEPSEAIQPKQDDTPEPPAAPELVAAGSATIENGARRFYSPVVMRIASERGVTVHELETVPGTGAGGRVTKKDILSYIESRSQHPSVPGFVPSTTASMHQKAPGTTSATPGRGTQVIPMNNMRRLMAEHMVRSKQISPHVALATEVDLTSVVRFRDKHADAFKMREGFTLTFMPFLADATIRALKEYPLMNSSVEGTNIIVKQFINLGIAVAMEDGGLIVPVIKSADALNLVGLARAVHDVASRARNKKLQPDEIQDGTFTISNFGVFGNTWGIPIINQPQVAILGVGALQKKPVVIEQDGQDVIAIRSMVHVSLSFDHRIIDGALGGKFVASIQQYLERFEQDSI